MKVLVVMPFQQAHKTYLEGLGNGCSFEYTTIQEATREQICGADIILGNANPQLVAQSENLKWIQLNSAGSDAYCKPGIIKPGTLLTCATGAYGLTVSEHLVSMSCMLCRKMDLYMRNQVQHRWQAEGSVTSVWNSTTLVVGLGDIGTEYAKRMKALGSHVIGIRRRVTDKPDCVDELYGMDRLDEMLPRADFVALILPSTPQTHHIMDERRMRCMKKGAYLLNGGRGDAVDCEALSRLLREGETLGGAALDVTEPEPLPATHPLWDAPRCIITPHVAGNFHLQETFERIVRITGENFEKFLAGDLEHMRNIVIPAAGCSE